MKNTKINTKEAARVYGIFAGILAFFILVSVLMILVSKNSWKNGLQEEIMTVLEEKYPQQWKMGEFIDQNIPFSYSSALFNLVSLKNAEKNYAAVIRINSMYGAIPAVFIYNKNKGVEFAGFAGIHGRVRKILEENTVSIRLQYWTERVEEIFAKAGIKSE